MYRFLPHSLIALIITLSPLAIAGHVPPDVEDFDLDTISICAPEQSSCPPSTCLEICIEQGLDPMDCPYLCNQAV